MVIEAMSAAAPGRGGRGCRRQRKRAPVPHLLRGEDLEAVSRSLGVTAATLSGWRDAFLAAGEASQQYAVVLFVYLVRRIAVRQPGDAQAMDGQPRRGERQLQERFGISRERQDAFAAKSHHLAHRAWEEGFYDDHVVQVKDSEMGRDEGIRADSPSMAWPGSTRSSVRAARYRLGTPRR